MNKSFRKMLSLLACAVLVGETMLTSVVAANDELAINASEDVTTSVSKEVSTVVDENKISIGVSADLEKTVETDADVETNETKIQNTEIVQNEEGSESATTGNGNLNKSCGDEVAKDFVKRLETIANSEKDSGIAGTSITNNGKKLILYVENGKLPTHGISYVTNLIDFILSKPIADGSIWSDLEEAGYHFDISDVTQLIDLNLRLELNKTFDLRGEFRSEGSRCEFEFQLEFMEKPAELSACNEDSTKTLMNKLAEIVNEEIEKGGKADIIEAKAEGNNIVLYVNEGATINGAISYVTSLIDYLLNPANDNSVWGRLNQAGFGLSISNVTQLIDFNLGYDTTFTSTVQTEDSACLLNVKLSIKTKDSSSIACNASATEKLLSHVADVINNEIRNAGKANVIEARVENNNIVLYVSRGTTVNGVITYVTSLIDYLLDPTNDNSVWSKLSQEGFGISISTLTELINFNLGLETTFTSTVQTEDIACHLEFNLSTKTKDSDGNNSNGNNNGNNSGSSSGGGSGRPSSSSNSSSDNTNEELEFGGQVDDSDNVAKCSIEGSTYSDEINNAYLWACEKGIVLADNIMNSNLNNPLTRAQLDKMMSIYAKQLLGRSYIVNDGVVYPDVNSSLGDLAHYIQEGYKLQIMGIHANGLALAKFSPNLLVTRGEFGTVFSRVLYGNVHNIDGANYYEAHLQALKNAGILTVTDPSLLETRGWVLLMLYRSQKVEESNGVISNEEIADITAETTVNEENETAATTEEATTTDEAEAEATAAETTDTTDNTTNSD